MPPPAAFLASLLLAAAVSEPAPTLAWRARYDGPGHRQDAPVQMARGPGGVFVLGTSFSPTTNDDFTLLKYTPQGVLVWARQYDGPAHSADRASALLPDGEGGAFVCGHGWGGSSWQVALVHYDAAGNLLWARTLASPPVIDLERGPRLARTVEGELRLGWTSGGNFLVAAFDGLGVPLWRREIDVVPGAEDFLTGLAVDSAGSTLVTGPVGGGFGGYSTVKLDRDGNLRWTDTELGDFGSTLGPAFVAIDEGDEVVLCGVPESSCGLLQTRTWRLAPDGMRRWTRSFPPASCDSAQAVDMALDAEGSALVLCRSTFRGTEDGSSISTLKYDRAGNEVWQRLISNPGEDLPAALDVDRMGNVYLAGVVGTDVHTLDGMAASYASDGSLRWIQSLRDEAPMHRPADIAVGLHGELYLSAATFFPSTQDDIMTLKLQQP